MQISPVAVGVGAAVILLGAGALAYSQSSTPSSSPSGTPPTPAAPIAITQGHRYQVTLTFGTAPGAQNLATNVLPNIAAGLNAVAPGEFAFVHAIAPKDNQIVFVVDAVGGAPGSVHQESPQTFYADLNPAQSGGFTLQVQDMGPSPVSAPAPGGGAGASLPPSSSSSSGATAAGPMTTITDPALVMVAQQALGALAQTGSLNVASPIPTSGVVDPATLVAVAQLQAGDLPPAQRSGQLDALTLAVAVLASLADNIAAAPITDPSLAAGAQKALAAAIALGNFAQIDYGVGQVNGQATDAAFVAALAAAAAQANVSAGTPIFATSGALDTRTFSLVMVTAYVPRTVGSGIVPVGPGTLVLAPADVTIAQQMLQALSASDPAYGTITPNGNPADPATTAAVKYFQGQLSAISHRTTPGVLDYLTLALLTGEALGLVYQGQTQNPGTLTGPAVTSPALVAGCQDALATLLRGGRLGANVATYDWNDVDGQASNAKFQTALRTVVQVIDTTTRSVGYQLKSDGSLDYYIFAALFVLAYV